MTLKLKDKELREPVSKHMRKVFITLGIDETVAHAIKSLRKHDIKTEILYLYVTDEHDRFVGVVPVRNLIAAEPHTKISSIMVRSPVFISASDTVLRACELFSEHRYLAIPVVDNDKKIIGIVDINLFTSDVVTLAHQRQIDSVFQLIGVHLTLGKTISSWSDFRGRFPWLLCNITSGIICAFIASRYEMLISQVVALAMFLTVALAMAESVSIQSMTLTLQTFMQHQTSWLRILIAIRKEILTAMMIGACAGLMVGVIVFIWKGVIRQGLAIGLSIWLAVITACLLGVIVPAVIRKFRVDPKIAAGPIVLAAADIATLLFYFLTADRLLG